MSPRPKYRVNKLVDGLMKEFRFTPGDKDGKKGARFEGLIHISYAKDANGGMITEIDPYDLDAIPRLREQGFRIHDQDCTRGRYFGGGYDDRLVDAMLRLARVARRKLEISR